MLETSQDAAQPQEKVQAGKGASLAKRD